MQIIDTPSLRTIKSENYNRVFDKRTGYMRRWGKTEDAKDDPTWSPFGPELLDIEITTACSGPGNKGPCKWCYKANTSTGKSMSLDTFKAIMNKLAYTGKGVGPCKDIKIWSFEQIAFGLDAKCESNKDWIDIFKYTKECLITPNLTIADISDETADHIASLAGACAVSRYEDKNLCYDSIKRLTDRGMTQVNIHALTADQTYDWIMETLQDRLTDPRLAKLNAIVMLSLKQKGRGTSMTPLSQDKYNNLVKYAMDHNISIGMDSCSAHKALKAFEGTSQYESVQNLIEPCESSKFSLYIDVDGYIYPCSFAAGTPGWESGINLLSYSNFIKEVWNGPRLSEFRDKLECNGRHCPYFTI